MPYVDQKARNSLRMVGLLVLLTVIAVAVIGSMARQYGERLQELEAHHTAEDGDG